MLTMLQSEYSYPVNLRNEETETFGIEMLINSSKFPQLIRTTILNTRVYALSSSLCLRDPSASKKKSIFAKLF